MPQFLYRVQLIEPRILVDGPSEAESDILQAHASYLEDLASRSVALLAGRTQTTTPDTFGIVILVTDSEAQARQIMLNDPAVKHGVMRAELWPFQIAMMAPDLTAHAP